MADFFLKRGDNLSQIQVQLVDNLGTPVNLYGASVRFIMRSFTSGEVILNNEAEIIDPSLGQVAYTWLEADTTIGSGDYYGEWQVTKQGTSNQTFPTRGYHLISIQDDLDSPTLTATQFMAVRRLRGMVAEAGQETYSDAMLSAMLRRNNDDLFLTAAEIWREKAAVYSELVDTSESGNSQKLSQLYKNAKDEAMAYEKASVSGNFLDSGSVGATIGAKTRQIVRV